MPPEETQIDPGELNSDPTGQPQPKPVFGQKVKIGEQEFVVDENLAKALKEQQEATNTRFDDLTNRVETLTQTVSQPPKQELLQPLKQPEADPYQYLGDLVFSDPAKAFQEFEGRIKKAIGEERAQATSEYRKDKAIDQFWNTFWKEHKDLKRDQDDSIAKHIGDQLALSGKTKGKTEKQIREMIGTGVREQLKGYMERFAGDAGAVPHVEGGGGNVFSLPSAGKEDPPETLNDSIRRRRDARRQASGKGTGGTK